MSRIRSVHPGLFTDEAFASCSPAAQILLIGVWTECDDNGIFEWKPVTLKMRIMPAHNVDVPALLEELDFHNIVKRFEIKGRWFGAVRNFTKYQRPKFPKSVHTITPDIRNYVGSTIAATEDEAVDGDPIPPNTEKRPQMKEVVVVKEEEEKKQQPLASRETRARKRKVSFPLPEEWQPTEKSRERARALHFAETQIDEIAEDLRVWANGKGECRADWDATFDGFVRRDAKHPNGHANGKTAPADKLLRAIHDYARPQTEETPGVGGYIAKPRT